MNFSTLSYLIVAIATLLFCGLLLAFVHDAGIPYFAMPLATLVIGHWFGYSNQLTNAQTTPAPLPVVTEPPKTT